MSDDESITAVAHPTMGGKSLEALQKPRYKSWRKKYRKIHVRFDVILEENKRLWKEEYKLQQIAKRLKEELDGLLELCLDLNDSPSIPPELRFNVKLPRHKSRQNVVPEDITPASSADLLAQYEDMVHDGRVPHLDLHVIRDQIDERLAERGARHLDDMSRDLQLPVALPPPSGVGAQEERWVGYLNGVDEDAFLLKQYAQLGDQWSLVRAAEQKETGEDKNIADLAPREQDKQIDLLNPQSQHNWLRSHMKLQPVVDDNDSLASTEVKPARKRTGKNLAKQVGDRAVERAREEWSPGAGSAFDEDELGFIDEYPSASGKKRVRDPDTTYRIKGGKSGGSSSKAKRKRASGDDGAGGNGNSAKKTKVDAGGD